ncbi:MAG TPA: right-handed parallel beta-helix repeat-containing protein, partial [Trueperaceae bacterium]|nr:right-handed parallel beta-helix repeat-containing protein [Trueperaceae bacterium]
GGGIHVDYQDWGGDSTGDVLLQGIVVRGNRASRGAGINVRGPRATIVGNLIADNVGHGDHGGGLYVSTAATTVASNVITGNVIGATAGYGWGGGVVVAAAAAEFRGNLISDNFAPSIGSGIFWDEGATGSMRNDLIVANRCPEDARSGAAIYVDGGERPSHVTVFNATIADHDCPDSTGGVVYSQAGSTITIRDSILWNNTTEFTDDEGGRHAITFSITTEAGTGNLVADPLFADAESGDYHLLSAAGRFTVDDWTMDALTSPAIDAGHPDSDYGSETEPNGGAINLGAYGNTSEASRSP